ncbi:Uncharacterized protein conserved in bacteria [Bordetella pertussis]|uniref:DUF924 family protein n=7 Tax=Bordetella TaxID=517 RepID=K0MHY9_BORPB|nr:MULTISPECIES: DUF924 family protein [Bordetella]ETH39714.1 PF06041 family protein [Bordetella pertussis H918]ETH44821.1 PF06041 family protein [Bordetella pertussis H939]ETH48466.1 PF06041 family protein [Bordetella pertussis H921]ETH71451.1 PF06041 family protein [Bordetella pertussis STO1-CHLA-0011]ETH84640.1 PF06041 family protein [Bordetella pertussis STO1-CHOC-0017]ETH87524.1 PF06041 family protein [Bordetella pertussis STO1-CHOC-0018]ETH92560.1 PF06041 family protein [Bordetella per
MSDSMAGPAALPDAATVLAFWREAGPARWYAKDEQFDRTFTMRFEAAHMAAARGELMAWSASAEGVLALLILLDQFPRNAYRGTGHMFATDGLARQICEQAIAAGLDRQGPEDLRQFYYMPLEHAEDLAAQEQCVSLMAPLHAETLRWAEIHRDIIARFGRFPHRNTVLGRATTAEEQQFLDQGGFSG